MLFLTSDETNRRKNRAKALVDVDVSRMLRPTARAHQTVPTTVQSRHEVMRQQHVPRLGLDQLGWGILPWQLVLDTQVVQSCTNNARRDL